MKTRTDFVSNSSSSSFILKDIGFFSYFGITKQDIIDAIAELKTSEPDGFCVYDMADYKDREACFKEWDEHFSNWVAPNEGEPDKWRNIVDVLRWTCDFGNIVDVVNGNDDVLISTVYNRKTRISTQVKFPDGVKLVRHIKEKLGVKSMKEVLHDEHCTLMIHFADNEVYGIKGMTEPGKADTRHAYTDDEMAAANASQWDSESYSAKRFFEILIKHFIAKGRVDLSDPGLLEFWNIADDDTWHKTTYPDKKTYLANDNNATWQDVFFDMLNCNAVMHEG